MLEQNNQSKHREVIIYIVVLISCSLTMCFALFLLYMLLHWFWGVSSEVPFFINHILRIVGLKHFIDTTMLKFASFAFFALGTVIFGYLSWQFAHRLTGQSVTSVQIVQHFRWKLFTGVMLLIVILLIAIIYFLLRFYF